MASLALALILTFIVVFEIIDRCNARDSYGAALVKSCPNGMVVRFEKAAL